ncbi:TIC 55, chloroplastic [Seminavis robusta]|uniref:TIC 55, chloroplastic n=1 Tax=Seminavis robusta TaxID=568900 RepID=A0A9N8HH40_9STRA|nr:TIC 55, chloroplastic [Seminavis robusta]|eukprot:Sro429_g141100.1 TIC 55, chloroplastic (578) ;mRNA; f:35329-37062
MKLLLRYCLLHFLFVAPLLLASLSDTFVNGFVHPANTAVNNLRRDKDIVGNRIQRILGGVQYGSRPILLSTLSPQPKEEIETLPYNWKDQWYALTFASHVLNPSETAEVVPAAVFGQPLVLWRSEDGGHIHCADDVCPHRAAALSEGRTRDGKLECYYHGWQFDGKEKGACSFIPQLSTGAQIPKAACLKMRECRVVEGIVWVWMGDGSSEPTKEVPAQNDELDQLTGQRNGFLVNDFQIDLPYDHSYLVENLIDPAHIDISHDRTPGGGRRERAEAYDMIVDKESVSPDGFTGRYRVESQAKKDGPYIEVQYQAPGIVRQRGFPLGANSTVYFGVALHCMPLALGRSRLLFRAYFGGLPKLLMFILSSKPAFLRHLNSCKVLEQDAGLITTQEDHFKRQPNHQIKDDFLMLDSSDAFVKAYRQWMDQVGHGMPWFQGLAKRSVNVDDHLTGFVGPPALDPMFHRAGNHMETRYHRHVVHCPATRNALARVQKLKRIMLGLAVLSVTLSCGTAPLVGSSSTGSALSPKMLSMAKHALKILVPFIPASCLASALLHRLEQAFFVSFKRKEQMRTEKGI